MRKILLSIFMLSIIGIIFLFNYNNIEPETVTDNTLVHSYEKVNMANNVSNLDVIDISNMKVYNTLGSVNGHSINPFTIKLYTFSQKGFDGYTDADPTGVYSVLYYEPEQRVYIVKYNYNGTINWTKSIGNMSGYYSSLIVVHNDYLSIVIVNSSDTYLLLLNKTNGKPIKQLVLNGIGNYIPSVNHDQCIIYLKGGRTDYMFNNVNVTKSSVDGYVIADVGNKLIIMNNENGPYGGTDISIVVVNKTTGTTIGTKYYVGTKRDDKLVLPTYVEDDKYVYVLGEVGEANDRTLNNLGFTIIAIDKNTGKPIKTKTIYLGFVSQSYFKWNYTLVHMYQSNSNVYVIYSYVRKDTYYEDYQDTNSLITIKYDPNTEKITKTELGHVYVIYGGEMYTGELIEWNNVSIKVAYYRSKSTGSEKFIKITVS